MVNNNNNWQTKYPTLDKTIRFLAPIFLVVGIIGIIGGINRCTKKENERMYARRDYIVNKGTLGIGVYKSVKYTTQSGGASRTDGVLYTHVVDGAERLSLDRFEGIEYDNAYDDFKKAEKGDKFLVIYVKEVPHDAIINFNKNPIEAIIKFDYPIKDSTDFKRYVKEFEIMRKKTKAEH